MRLLRHQNLRMLFGDKGNNGVLKLRKCWGYCRRATDDGLPQMKVSFTSASASFR